MGTGDIQCTLLKVSRQKWNFFFIINTFHADTFEYFKLPLWDHYTTILFSTSFTDWNLPFSNSQEICNQCKNSLLAGGSLYTLCICTRVWSPAKPVAILDKLVEDLGWVRKKTACPKTCDFSGQKSNPVHQQTGFVIGRVGVKRTIVTQENYHRKSQRIWMARLVVAFSKILIRKEKPVTLKPEQETTVICLLRGEDALAVLPTGFVNYDFHGVCTVSTRAEQTNFSIGYFTDQKYYCRPTCRPSRYFYSNRTAVAAQIPSTCSFLTSLWNRIVDIR